MNQVTIRFVAWLIGMALVGSGLWMICPPAALIVVGGIVWAQTVITELIDLHRMHNAPIPKQVRRTDAK